MKEQIRVRQKLIQGQGRVYREEQGQHEVLEKSGPYEDGWEPNYAISEVSVIEAALMITAEELAVPCLSKTK